MVQVTIDGQTIEAQAGMTVLQVCREAGILIPTLCDHPSLKPYGGCRLCVVEVEGFRALQASCTLPVFNDMVIHTSSARVCKAREFILSLLFSERNHFCMFCQKTGGDCELQNAAYLSGMTHWSLQPTWKPFAVDASHAYIAIDHNRCILCRRCVRACRDLVGNATLGIENRGAISLLAADNGLPLGESSCISCGTCVQVCPTGALIDRESAYMGRSSESTRVESICIGCSVGCGIEMLVRDNRVIRVEGRWGAPVNGGVLCEQGRYIENSDGRARLRTPLLRKNGSLEPASWEQALQAAAQHLLAVKSQPPGIAALVSTRLPAEALYAFKNLFVDQLHSTLVTSIEEDLTSNHLEDLSRDLQLGSLKTGDLYVIIGADLTTSHQVAGFMIKRNLLKGSQLVVIDPYDNNMDELAQVVLKPAAGADALLLWGIMKAIHELGLDKHYPTGAKNEMEDINTISRETHIPASTIGLAGRLIGSAARPVFVYGKGVTRYKNGQVLSSIHKLAEMVGGETLHIKGKANSLAAQCFGLAAPFQPEGGQTVFLALGDDKPTRRLVRAVEKATSLVVLASYHSEITDRADVVLPVHKWAEQEGHFVNMGGRRQRAQRGVQPPAEVRSSLEAMQALAEAMGIELQTHWEEELARRLPLETPVAG